PTPSRIGSPPTRSRAAIRLVRTLTRSIVLASRSAIQREPKPSARPIGASRLPLTCPTRRFECGLIRVTWSPQWAPAAQTALRPAARKPQGCPEARILETTLFVAGSIRTTAFRFGTPTQTAPPPAVTLINSEAAEAGPTPIVATTRFVEGSMRETLGPPPLATQTAPAETATCRGCGPTLIVAATAFACGSMRETVLSRSEEHTSELQSLRHLVCRLL